VLGGHIILMQDNAANILHLIFLKKFVFSVNEGVKEIF